MARPLPDSRARRRDGWLAVALIVLAFACVYWRSLAFVYIEGDDAQIVAHHAMGRDNDVMPVYSAYQSMFDGLLVALPAREDVIRVASLGLTAMCAPLLAALMTLLAFDWTAGLRHRRWFGAALLLLAVPELFYLGMVVTPSVIAMTLAVAAHLVLRRSGQWSGNRRHYAFVGSAMLFGFGAGIRWDTVLYGVTVGADILLGGCVDRASSGPRVRRRITDTAVWGGLAAATWLAAVYVNGYSPLMVLRALGSAGPVESFSLVHGLSRIQTLSTPLFAVLGVVGMIALVRGRAPLSIIAVLSFVVVGKLALYGVPKWMITAIPAWVAVAMAGASVAWQRPAARYALIVLGVLPWLLGVRMTYGSSAWGPAFEIRRYDAAPASTTWPTLVLGAGTAIPTPEGPRPLFGHAWVLGGAWTRFVTGYWLDQQEAVATAIRLKLPLLVQDYSQGWGATAHLQLGFSTSGAAVPLPNEHFVLESLWMRPDGVTARMMTLAPGRSVAGEHEAGRLQQICDPAVVTMAFSSTLAHLHQLAPEALEPLGNTTAVLHLDRLANRAPRPPDARPHCEARDSLSRARPR